MALFRKARALCNVHNRFLSSQEIIQHNKKMEQKTQKSRHQNAATEELKPSITRSSMNLSGYGQPTSETHPHILKPGEVTQGISKKEFNERRDKLVNLISQYVSEHKALRRETAVDINYHFCIIPSAPRQYMTNDIPYVYYQNTDFNYFTGFLEPQSILLIEFLTHSVDSYKPTLFVETRDDVKVLWEGPCSGLDGSKVVTGIDHLEDIDNFPRYMESRISDINKSECAVWYDLNTHTNTDLHKKYIGPFLEQQHFAFMDRVKPFAHNLRVRKSSSEQELMRKSCEIASQAFREVMRCSHTFVEEARLNAVMEYECRLRGASGLAYPPVIAGGDRANTIHYINNDRVIGADELVLMDAGCLYHHYCSDITRTWPVSGTFTEPQRVLYEVLYEVQLLSLELLRTVEVSLDQLYYNMLHTLAHKLADAHIVPADAKDPHLVAQRFCPHHIGHYLGMDVHDTSDVGRGCVLEAGMCVTVEPGIYIPRGMSGVREEFHGLGMRIEDDVMITDTDVLVLTDSCPKSTSDIEKTVLIK